jgi:hypothetical protein
MVRRRQDAKRHAGEDRQTHGEPRQRKRDRQATGNQLAHRHLVLNRHSQIAGECAPQPIDILPQERPIEAKLGAKRCQCLRIPLRSRDDFGRVTGNDVDHHEGNEGHKEQSDGKSDGPTNQITAHALYFTL